MRVAVIATLLAVLAAVALWVGGRDQSQTQAAETVAAPTVRVDPYGPPIIGSGEPSAATTPASTASVDTSAPTSSPATTSPTTSVVVAEPEPSDEATDASVGTIGDETVLVVDGDHEHETESEPESIDPETIGAGGFPITSNLAAGAEYPLDAMVQLAVDLLAAETTGIGQESYPHLTDQISVCCTDLEVEAAAVLFGTTQTDPATMIIEWRAVRRVGGGSVHATTQTRWWWLDGSWRGEFELPEGFTP